MELRYGLADSAMRLQVPEGRENSPSDSASTQPSLTVLTGGVEDTQIQELNDPWFDGVTEASEAFNEQKDIHQWMNGSGKQGIQLGEKLGPIGGNLTQMGRTIGLKCQQFGQQVGGQTMRYARQGFTGLGTGCIFVYRRIGKSFVWFYDRFQQQKLARSMALNDRWFESSVEVGLTRDPVGILCVALPLIVCVTTSTGMVFTLLS